MTKDDAARLLDAIGRDTRTARLIAAGDMNGARDWIRHVLGEGTIWAWPAGDRPLASENRRRGAAYRELLALLDGAR